MFWLITLLLAPFLQPPKNSEFVVAGPSHQGEEITCDLPLTEHLKNLAGIDGLGLCVFTSLELAARWQNETKLFGLRDYMTQLNGGGWPERVEEILARYTREKNLPPVEFVQHTGGEIEFLQRALQTGRYPCVTYDGRDGQFYKGRIAHMVNLAHLSSEWAVIQDNNHPQKWLWMKPADFLARWRGTGGGWAIVLLKPSPPPIPVNLQPSFVTHLSPIAASPILAPPQTNSSPAAEILECDNFGLGIKYLKGSSQYRLNGQIVTREEALRSLGNVPDDRERLRLTLVGNEEFQKKVWRELTQHPGWSQVERGLLVQSYPENHWAITGVGLRKGITLQRPANREGKGAVLFRIENYQEPNAVITAIRKADPNYQPERDPDPTRPRPPVAPTPNDPETQPTIPVPSPTWGQGFWALAGCALALFIHHIKERTRS
ncbi:MAG: hypothetical protein N2112_12975 [Gemmataceae bacterium]|nr:hypothetical protein [Gemmataceae bacterium]